jgi:hypothetical protein
MCKSRELVDAYRAAHKTPLQPFRATLTQFPPRNARFEKHRHTKAGKIECAMGQVYYIVKSYPHDKVTTFGKMVQTRWRGRCGGLSPDPDPDQIGQGSHGKIPALAKRLDALLRAERTAKRTENKYRSMKGRQRRSREQINRNENASARVEDALLQRHGDGFGPVSDFELGADVIDMIANGVLADLEHSGNLLVGKAF